MADLSSSLVGSGLFQTFPQSVKNGTTGSGIADLRLAVGLLEPWDIHRYTKFSRFGFFDPYSTAGTIREYLFFTKPDLLLFDGSAVLSEGVRGVSFFEESLRLYPDAMAQLHVTNNTRTDPFMTLLSNHVSSPMDLPELSGDDMVGPVNMWGDTVSYRWSSDQSDMTHEFSLEFIDTRFLEVYRLFKVYDEYERQKAKGRIPYRSDYLKNKISHDKFSIYKFLVDDDGESILFYAKAYGVYPKGAPRDALANISGGQQITFSVQFHADFVDDNDPLILNDFNRVSVGQYKSIDISKLSTLPLYNYNIGAIDGTWASRPIIKMDYSIGDSSGHRIPRHKLKWI
jgi:hypothetical protein